MIEIDERIAALTAHAPVPETPVADDVRRGRRRLRARRAVAWGGATAVAASAALAGVALGDRPGEQARDRTPVAVVPPEVAPPPSGADRFAELGALLEADGRSDAVFTLQELRDLTDTVERRFGRTGRWHAVETTRSWAAAGAGACPSGWACADLRVRGADRARTAQSGGVRQVAVDFGGDVLVLTIASGDVSPKDLAWTVRER